MARRDGELVAGITAYADGPVEMREVINHHIKLGVDQIKLSMSGEEASYTSHTHANKYFFNSFRSRLQKLDLPKIVISRTRRQLPVLRKPTNKVAVFAHTLAPGTLLKCV